MSNSYINIRFGTYHYKVLRDSPWVSREFNSYHVSSPYGWFAIYEFPGLNWFLNK